MKKLLLAAVVATMAIAPFAAHAHDSGIDDATDCDARTETTVRAYILDQDDPTAADPNEIDRGSVCVKDPDGNTVAYVGGELVSEENPGAETGVACGAVIVNGEVLAGADTKDFNHGEDHNHCD